MIDFFFEFLPQLLLLSVLFGYMCLLIIVKWLTPWKNTAEAPSIISFMINIYLKNGDVVGKPLLGSVATNISINRTMAFIAILCVPLMLLVKPLYEKFSHQDKHAKVKVNGDGDGEHARDIKNVKYSMFQDEEEEKGNSLGAFKRDKMINKDSDALSEAPMRNESSSSTLNNSQIDSLLHSALGQKEASHEFSEMFIH
jgi:V-type H+-transporting ATPase subunit a